MKNLRTQLSWKSTGRPVANWNPTPSLLLAGALCAVIFGCKADVLGIRAVREHALAPEVRKSAQDFIEAYQHRRFEPPQLQSSSAFEVQSGNKVSIFIPAIYSQTTDDHEFLPQCRLIEVKNKNGKLYAGIVDRAKSGLSDDFEPCTAISKPLFVDVNGDGNQDVIFSVTRINGIRAEYILRDVYLASPDLGLCHSKEASTVFIPERQTPISKDVAERISKSESGRLASLRCPNSK